MRWATAGLAVLLLGAAAAGDETTPGWVKFSSDEANVAIVFPGKPKVRETPNGGKEAIYEGKGGKVAFMLRFDPFPAKIDPTDAAAADKVFDGVKDGLKKSGGKITSERLFKTNKKYPVLEIDSSAEAVPDHRIRIIVTEKWLLQVHAGGPKGTPAGEDAQLFMNSLLIKESD